MQPDQNSVSSKQSSFTLTNFKRSISYGKVYLIMGIALPVALLILFSFLGKSNPRSATYLTSVVPMIIPVFAVLASLGALMIFVSDKVKGVYEYLIAYGVNTSIIFWSIVISSIGLVGIMLIITIPVSLITVTILLSTIPDLYFQLIFFYTIPLSIASTMFMTMVGMIWSSLSTRRAALNSPVGLAPIFGIVPNIVVLVTSEIFASQDPTILLSFVSGVSVIVIIVVFSLIAIAGKKMTRERFLGNV